MVTPILKKKQTRAPIGPTVGGVTSTTTQTNNYSKSTERPDTRFNTPPTYDTPLTDRADVGNFGQNTGVGAAADAAQDAADQSAGMTPQPPQQGDASEWGPIVQRAADEAGEMVQDNLVAEDSAPLVEEEDPVYEFVQPTLNEIEEPFNEYMDPQTLAWLRTLYDPIDTAADEAAIRERMAIEKAEAMARMQARSGIMGMGGSGYMDAMAGDLRGQFARSENEQILEMQRQARQEQVERGLAAAGFFDQESMRHFGADESRLGREHETGEKSLDRTLTRDLAEIERQLAERGMDIDQIGAVTEMYQGTFAMAQTMREAGIPDDVVDNFIEQSVEFMNEQVNLQGYGSEDTGAAASGGSDGPIAVHQTETIGEDDAGIDESDFAGGEDRRKIKIQNPLWDMGDPKYAEVYDSQDDLPGELRGKEPDDYHQQGDTFYSIWWDDEGNMYAVETEDPGLAERIWKRTLG